MTRTERTYYLVFGGYSLAQFFIAPIYPLFLLSRGCDLFQMNVVLAVYLLTVFVFEVPTGAIADVFGRKVSFLLACLVRLVAYTLYAFAEDFADCLVAEVIDAVGTTLASGALEAWVVDGVRAEGDRRPTDALFARAQMIARGVMVGGAVVCGYVTAAFGWTVPWLACAALFGATAATGAILMREQRPTPQARAERSPSIASTVAAAVTTVRGAPVLLILYLLTLSTALAAFPFLMLWPRRVEQLIGGESLTLIGWLTACLHLAALAGSAVLPRLLDRHAREVVLFFSGVWRAALIGIAALASGISPVAAGLLLQEISAGLTDPVLTAWTNEHIAPAERATTLSVRSVFFTVGGAAGLVGLGLVARDHGIPAAWGVSALVLALTAPGFLALGRLARRAPTSAAVVPLPPVPSKITPAG